MLMRKVEGEMALLSEGSSVKEKTGDKQVSVPCVKGSTKISRRVTLALYTGENGDALSNIFFLKFGTVRLLSTFHIVANMKMNIFFQTKLLKKSLFLL